MNLLTKSAMGKADKSAAKTEYSPGKLTVFPTDNGKASLSFPLSFSCYKTISLTVVAKKTLEKTGSATVGVTFLRRGNIFGPSGTKGRIELCGDNYKEYKLHYFIPFGVDEAFVSFYSEGGAGISILALDAEVNFGFGNFGGGIECVAEGGLSSYAPKNSMSAVLAALRAGYKRIVVDAAATSDGVIVAHDGSALSGCSDGEGLIEETEYEKLKTYDFGMFSGDFYKNTRISSLSDVFMQMQSAGSIPIVCAHGLNFPFETLENMYKEFGFGAVKIMASQSISAEKIKKALPDSQSVYISDYYSNDDVTRDFVVSDERTEILFRVNTSADLERAIKGGEKKIVTSVYQLDGCKI